MIKKGTTSIEGIYKGTTEIGSIYKGTNLVYENFKTLTAQGIPPITLQKCKNTNMLGYKVYGNSKQQLLPDGYTQLEYIESTGTQYIDTGIIPAVNQQVICKFSNLKDINKNSENYVFGHYPNVGGYSKAVRAGAFTGSNYNPYRYSQCEYFDTNGNIISTEITESNTIIVKTNNPLTLDTNPLASYHIFAQGRKVNNVTTVMAYSKVRLHYFKIIDTTTNEIISNFIPCKNPSSVAGLYDLVEGKFYENKGTGTFTVGSTIKPTSSNPIEVQTVGNQTNNYFDTHKVSRFNYDITVGDDSISISGGYQTIVNFKPYDLKPNTTYTMKYHLSRTQAVSTVQGRVRFAKSDNSTSIAVINNSDASSLELDLIGTFTTPSDIREYTRMWFYSGTGTTEFKNIHVVEGTYTLQTMPDYESYGYNIPVTVGGKNICNPNSFTNTGKLLDGVNGNLNNNTNYKTTDFIFIKAGTYTLSLDNTYDGTSSTTTRMCLYNTSYEYTGNAVSDTSVRPTRPSYTFTVSNDCYYRLSVRNTDENVMIEKKDSATSYEPYFAPRTTNIYLREPLRKLDNTYYDYIDFETQKVYRKVAQQYYDGYSNSVNAQTSRYTDYTRFTLATFNPVNEQTGAYEEMCNYFPQGSSVNCFIVGYNNAGFLYLPDTLIGTTSEDTSSERVTKANNWLKTLLPVLYITYPRSTTSEESITLPDILLNKGANVVSVGTNLTPSNMWIKYKGKE